MTEQKPQSPSSQKISPPLDSAGDVSATDLSSNAQTHIQRAQSESGNEGSEVAFARSGLVSNGSMLGPYQIVRKLGQGGMGAVYEARHTKLKKTFAVKVLPPEMMKSPALVARFEREMEAVGALDHPHIVRATDAGEFNGTHFLVMEFVDGTDLAQLVKQNGPLPIDVALEVIRQAALGLQHAHEHGLVHRDIKPSNLLMASSVAAFARTRVAGGEETGKSSRVLANAATDFTIKILDLGLARLGGDDSPSGLTSSGQMLGTPDYMAPEQWDDTRSVDARADLYSLGCTLAFLLTGKAPFDNGRQRSFLHIMKAHADASVPDLTALRSDVSAEVNSLFQRLMAKRPEDRFQSAAEVVAAIESFRSRVRQNAGEGSAAEPGAPRVLANAATSLDVARATDSSATTDITHASGVPVAERQGDVDAPTTSILAPRSSLRKTSTTRQRVILAVSLLAFVALGAIVIKITRKDGTTLEVVIPDDTKKVEITESDGSRVRQNAGDGNANVTAKPRVLANAATGDAWKPIPVGDSPFDKLDPAAIPAEERFEWQPQELVAVIGNHARRHWGVASVFISPDGKYAASVGDSRIIVWDMGTQTPLGEYAYAWPNFSEDSTSLYLHGHVDNRPQGVIDLTKQPLVLTPFSIKIPEPGGWAHQTRIEDGRTLVAREWGGQQRAILVDVSGDQPVVGGTVSCSHCFTFLWSATGIAVYRSKEGQLRRVEIKDAKFVNDRELAVGDGTGSPLAISPDGKRVVLHANKMLELWDIAGESPKKTMGFGRFDIAPIIALSADGRWMTTSYSETKLWRIDGSEPKMVGWLDKTGRAGGGSVAFSQDCNRAIVGSDNGFVRFWDLSGDTPKELSPPNLAQAFQPPAYTRPQLDPRTGRLMLQNFERKPGFAAQVQLWDFSAPAPRPYPAPDIVLGTRSGGSSFSLSDERWVNVGDDRHSHQTYSIRDGVWGSAGLPFGTNSPLSTVSPDGSWLFAFSGTKPGEYTIEGWNVREQPAKKWTQPFDTTYPIAENVSEFLSSHDGSVFAVAHGDGNGGEVTLFRHHGDRAEKCGAVRFRVPSGLYRAALSPYGGWLVHTPEPPLHHLVITDIRTGQAQELARTNLGGVRWLTFSPDGQRVASATDIGGGFGRVGVLDAKTLAPLYEWKSPGPVEWLDFAPDGRHLITLNGNHTVYVLRLPPNATLP